MPTTTDEKRKPPDSLVLAATVPTEPEEKMRVFRARLDPAGHATVTRAIVLELAKQACFEADDEQLAGRALVAIAKDYLRQEAARLNGRAQA